MPDEDNADEASDDADGQDGDMAERGCAAASLAMFDVLMEECGQGDRLISELATMMGVPKQTVKEDGSFTAGCHAVLREGKDDIETPTETNAHVLCRAWELVTTGDADSLREALDTAWNEV